MTPTNIRISKKTRWRLAKLKTKRKTTYDEIINSLLDLIPSGDDEGEYTEEFRASLLRSLAELRNNYRYLKY